MFETSCGWCHKFNNSTASRTALGSTQPPIQWVPGALSLGVKRPGREADYSPPSTAEVKEWVELYLHSPIRLHGVVLSYSTGTTLPLLYHCFHITSGKNNHLLFSAIRSAICVTENNSVANTSTVYLYLLALTGQNKRFSSHVTSGSSKMQKNELRRTSSPCSFKVSRIFFRCNLMVFYMCNECQIELCLEVP
jgi:hypothetical protein